MKISKLFHWLYAVLMFLPIIAIGVKCLYVVFNDNAVDSYRGEYKFDSYVSLTADEKSALTPLPIISYTYFDGPTYFWEFQDTEWYGGYNIILPTSNFTGIGRGAMSLIPNLSYVRCNNLEYDTCNAVLIGFYNRSNSTRPIIAGYHINGLTGLSLGGWDDGRLYQNVLLEPLFTYDIYDTAVSIYFVKNDRTMAGLSSAYDGFPINLTSLVENIKVPSYVVDTTLSSVFYSSLQELDENEFFGWAKDSFLTAPIMYIGALFGIMNPHPIFTLMSYWLAVSIIWLVFDLVMYVPLLIHRWLDKGVVE